MAFSRSPNIFVIFFDKVGETIFRFSDVTSGSSCGAISRGFDDFAVDEQLEPAPAEAATLLADVDGLGMAPDLNTIRTILDWIHSYDCLSSISRQVSEANECTKCTNIIWPGAQVSSQIAKTRLLKFPC